LILAVEGGTIAEVSTALRELLVRIVDVGTIPGGVAVLGAGNAGVVTAGVASIGGGPMGEDAIMRIQSITKVLFWAAISFTTGRCAAAWVPAALAAAVSGRAAAATTMPAAAGPAVQAFHRVSGM
jgi:Beta-lactamase